MHWTISILLIFASIIIQFASSQRVFDMLDDDKSDLRIYNQYRGIHLTRSTNQGFLHKNLIIEKSKNIQKLPDDVATLEFGKFFSNHMIEVEWSELSGWSHPKLAAFTNFNLHPASPALHYAIAVFEGMKAFYGVDGKIRLFRPERNMERMCRSAHRACLPDFSANEALKMIEELVRIDHEMIPKCDTASFYLRPMLFGTDDHLRVSDPRNAKWACFGCPSGEYFTSGSTGISLLADPSNVRSWPGGVGEFKMACNYAPTIRLGKAAGAQKCDQVLWLSDHDQKVTESGAMNFFMLWTNEQKEVELITAPLDAGLLLPGVTRESILELAREWGEFKVSEKWFTMHELCRAAEENRIHEIFVTGTAAVICPVGKILYVDESRKVNQTLNIPTMSSKTEMHKRFRETINAIQYGKIERKDWQHVVEI